MKKQEFESMVSMYNHYAEQDKMVIRAICTMFLPIKRWQDDTFPHGLHSPATAHAHLEKELVELRESNYDDLEEWADAFMLMLAMAYRSKFTLEDVLAAVMVKFFINRDRIWDKPDENGVCQHIEEDG